MPDRIAVRAGRYAMRDALQHVARVGVAVLAGEDHVLLLPVDLDDTVVAGERDIGVDHRREGVRVDPGRDRKSTRLNSSHVAISYAVFCLKKKKNKKCTSSRRTVALSLPSLLARPGRSSFLF